MARSMAPTMGMYKASNNVDNNAERLCKGNAIAKMTCKAMYLTGLRTNKQSIIHKEKMHGESLSFRTENIYTKGSPASPRIRGAEKIQDRTSDIVLDAKKSTLILPLYPNPIIQSRRQ
jgi:hypothetical protein